MTDHLGGELLSVDRIRVTLVESGVAVVDRETVLDHDGDLVAGSSPARG